MAKTIKAVLLGDAMILGDKFEAAWGKCLGDYGSDLCVGDWETNWDKLQFRRLEVEKHGPDIEPADPFIVQHGADREALLGLFVPVSANVMDAMPSLRIVGVSRAGLENVNVGEATKRGILVFNVQGRNAQAVSDFAVGMMLAECRNIARAHLAIKNGTWRKKFVNSEFVPELTGRTVGIVGFGYIGRLVAQKLSGFNVRRLVYDPFASSAEIEAAGCFPADLDTLMKESDFVTLHARLTDENKNMIGAEQIGMMKPTAYLVNTGRAGLLDNAALIEALQQGRIMGAALDVYPTEPVPADSPLLELDNVTMTTHIAGSSADALGNSPTLLMNDIDTFLKGGSARFIVNPEVLDNDAFKNWLNAVRA